MVLAERGANLESLQRQRQNVFNLAQRSQNRAFGQDSEKGVLQKDEDMGVRVGDDISHHYHAEQKQNNPWLPIIAAGLLGTLGALAVNHFMKDDSGMIDTDTVTELEIYRPDGEESE